jgi:predicted NAD-dependent protein-ADP-ribosyltransferase YbiA (DUF1768 family)
MCAQDGDVEGGKSAEDLKDELLGSGDVVLVEAAFPSKCFPLGGRFCFFKGAPI